MDCPYAHGREVLYSKSDEPYDKHVHVLFDLQDGRQLRYHDTRKFGKMYLYEKRKDIHQYPCFQNIGLDAFDERLTPTYLYHALHKRKIVLKAALLDQSVIAGIGNIYADEICFALGMHPETKIYHLRKKILNGCCRKREESYRGLFVMEVRQYVLTPQVLAWMEGFN